MAYPYQPWRAALLPASFGGARVPRRSRRQSRRPAHRGHEYPKSDTPFAEDMGRKAAGWQITAYLIGPDYSTTATRSSVCDSEGPFTLVHPTFGAMQVHCGPYTASESRERGGYAHVDMPFFEAGQNPDARATTDTHPRPRAPHRPATMHRRRRPMRASRPDGRWRRRHQRRRGLGRLCRDTGRSRSAATRRHQPAKPQYRPDRFRAAAA